MPVVPRRSDNGVLAKPVLWWAGSLIVVLIGVSAANASPAPSPAAPSATAGITVTGIAGGRVRVAIIEMGGQSYVVGVGDRIRDFTVKAIAPNEVVLGRDNRTFRLPVSRANTSQTTLAEAPAVAIPAAATPAPAGTSAIGAPPLTEQPAAAQTVLRLPAAPAAPQPPTVPITSLNLGSTGYPPQTAVPVWGVPLTPAPPNPQAIPPAATLYTPSGTSVYGFATAPITTQSTVTQRGVTVLPVASNQVQPDTRALPPGATLYTPSGTSLYGIASAPITTQSEVTLFGATGLPVAANQAQTVTQVLPWPLYRVEVGPFSDQQGALDTAESLAKAGFTARVDANTAGQYTVTLTPPPQATVAQGLAVLKSIGADLPIRIQLVPGISPSQPAVGPAPQQPAIAPGPAAAPGTVLPPASPSAASSQATPSRGYVQLYLVKVGPISNRHRAEEIANRLIKAGFAARVSVTGTQFTITLKPSTQQAVGLSLAIVQSVQADVPVKIELSP